MGQGLAMGSAPDGLANGFTVTLAIEDHMAENAPSTTTRARSGDLARRIAERRRQIGLGSEEVARRAGMHSGYPSTTSNTAPTPR